MQQFPFGQPLLRVVQVPNPRARVFVLGVYSSAVHARWIGPDGRQLVQALAVASEPSIFWRGEGASEIIKTIHVPSPAGRLELPLERFNGPSGISLDHHYLAPLGLSRLDAWLCDLLPESRMNANQEQKVVTKYAPLARRLGLPEATVPAVPSRFADGDRVDAILEEFLASGAETLITLGDAPLRDFVAPLGIGHAKLSAYGSSHEEYGRARAGQAPWPVLPAYSADAPPARPGAWALESRMGRVACGVETAYSLLDDRHPGRQGAVEGDLLTSCHQRSPGAFHCFRSANASLSPTSALAS